MSRKLPPGLSGDHKGTIAFKEYARSANYLPLSNRSPAAHDMFVNGNKFKAGDELHIYANDVETFFTDKDGNFALAGIDLQRRRVELKDLNDAINSLSDKGLFLIPISERYIVVHSVLINKRYKLMSPKGLTYLQDYTELQPELEALDLWERKKQAYDNFEGKRDVPIAFDAARFDDDGNLLVKAGAATRSQTKRENGYTFADEEIPMGNNGKLLPLSELPGQRVQLKGITKLLAQKMTQSVQALFTIDADMLENAVGIVQPFKASEIDTSDFYFTGVDVSIEAESVLDERGKYVLTDDTVLKDLIVRVPFEKMNLYARDDFCPRGCGDLCSESYVDLKKECVRLREERDDYGIDCRGRHSTILSNLCTPTAMTKFDSYDTTSLRDMCDSIVSEFGADESCTGSRQELIGTLAKYFEDDKLHVWVSKYSGIVGTVESARAESSKLYDFPTENSPFITLDNGVVVNLLTHNEKFTEVEYRGYRGFLNNRDLSMIRFI